jgi:hypothetical protein
VLCLNPAQSERVDLTKDQWKLIETIRSADGRIVRNGVLRILRTGAP